jgi:hypothetical protein
MGEQTMKWPIEKKTSKGQIITHKTHTERER